MKNFIQPGECLDLVAPYALASGDGALIGEIFGVATKDIALGATGAFCVEGVFALNKTAVQAWVTNQPVYWNVTTRLADSDPSTGPRIGVSTAVAANPTSSGRVLLDCCCAKRKLTSVYTASPAPASKNTAGPVTLTAAEVLSGIVVADPTGAARTYTLPSAALLVAAVPNAQVGDVIRCHVINGADAAEVLTLAEGLGGAFDANQTAASRVIGQNGSKDVLIRLTNVTAAAEAYVVYA